MDRKQMDLGSISGLVMGIGLILLANKIEGGQLKQIFSPTALMIVIGGTLGACILQFPLKITIRSLKAVVSVFLAKKTDPDTTIAQIVDFAKRARREGILALEKEIESLPDPFFVKALRMAVDGLEPKQLIETMEAELATIEEEFEGPVKFFEACGGYAPTMGILGAVLGLIQVMSNLSDPSKLGEGIAIAFVATVYGVGSANLIFLPFSTKIKFNSKQLMKVRDIILKGVLLIQEGINHSIIEEQLKSYLDDKEKARYDKRGEAAGAGAASAASAATPSKE
jgi:chemotaxis protein MotA